MIPPHQYYQILYFTMRSIHFNHGYMASGMLQRTVYNETGKSLPSIHVTTSSDWQRDVNGVRSVTTGVFVAGHVTCFQMSPYSRWTSLASVVGSGDDDEMNSR